MTQAANINGRSLTQQSEYLLELGLLIEEGPSRVIEVSPEIEVRDLEMSYGSYVVMRDINFTVAKGQVLVIMGGSGCGKSTLLKCMIGLKEVTHGDVLYKGESFVKASEEEREEVQRTFGFYVQIEGSTEGVPLRIILTQEAYPINKVSPMVELPGPGRFHVRFDDAIYPAWCEQNQQCEAPPGQRATESSIYDFEVQVVGGLSEADFNVCVKSLSPFE